jgi:hypothetical protein
MVSKAETLLVKGAFLYSAIAVLMLATNIKGVVPGGEIELNVPATDAH